MSANTVFVVPKAGYKIPDPDRKDFLPASGRLVEHSLYWIRLLSDGDVVEGSDDTAAAPAADPQLEKLQAAEQVIEDAIASRKGNSGKAASK